MGTWHWLGERAMDLLMLIDFLAGLLVLFGLVFLIEIPILWTRRITASLLEVPDSTSTATTQYSRLQNSRVIKSLASTPCEIGWFFLFGWLWAGTGNFVERYFLYKFGIVFSLPIVSSIIMVGGVYHSLYELGKLRTAYLRAFGKPPSYDDPDLFASTDRTPLSDDLQHVTASAEALLLEKKRAVGALEDLRFEYMRGNITDEAYKKREAELFALIEQIDEQLGTSEGSLG